MCEKCNLYLVTEAPNCASLKTIVGSVIIRMTFPRISVTPSLNLQERTNTNSCSISPKGIFFFTVPKIGYFGIANFQALKQYITFKNYTHLLLSGGKNYTVRNSLGILITSRIINGQNPEHFQSNNNP